MVLPSFCPTNMGCYSTFLYVHILSCILLNLLAFGNGGSVSGGEVLLAITLIVLKIQPTHRGTVLNCALIIINPKHGDCVSLITNSDQWILWVYVLMSCKHHIYCTTKPFYKNLHGIWREMDILRHSYAIWCHVSYSAFVYVMSYRLFIAKPLHKTLLTTYLFHPSETSVKFQSN